MQPKSWLQLATSASVVRRACLYATIVGSVLVLINHGNCVMHGKFGWDCFWKSLLSMLVPYTVTTVSSVQAIRCHSHKERSTAIRDDAQIQNTKV